MGGTDKARFATKMRGGERGLACLRNWECRGTFPRESGSHSASGGFRIEFQIHSLKFGFKDDPMTETETG